VSLQSIDLAFVIGILSGLRGGIDDRADDRRDGAPGAARLTVRAGGEQKRGERECARVRASAMVVFPEWTPPASPALGFRIYF